MACTRPGWTHELRSVRGRGGTAGTGLRAEERYGRDRPPLGSDTPGCTTEACEFRDAYDVFRERGAEVLGVSPDDVASHEKFRTKYELPFTLLADPDHRIADKYGVWGEKRFAGKTYMGINRSTFIIDQNGNVARAMMGIKPAGHAAQVLDSLP